VNAGELEEFEVGGMTGISVTAKTGKSEIGVERIGPYAIYDEIGSGGMATVHLGKLLSASGFTRTVAIKRMHAELARSPEFVAMFFQEARLVGRIQHPNVVAALDCVAVNNSAMLVMEYVHGLSLNQLMRKPLAVPRPIASAILIGAALGLNAAHDAVDENGKNLGIVHRDVSPHNILVGVDGLPRVLDFGVAKAAECVQHTRTGEVKGKIGYMAPEQLLGETVGREADVYSLGVIMWELMTGRRFFVNEGQAQMMMRIATAQIDSPRTVNPKVPAAVEAVVMKALARSPEARYRTALEFAVAVEACIAPSGQRAVGEWIAAAGKDELSRRSQIRAQIDHSLPGWAREAPEDNEFTRLRERERERAKPSVSQVSRIRRGVPPKVLVAVATFSVATAMAMATVGAFWRHSASAESQETIHRASGARLPPAVEVGSPPARLDLTVGPTPGGPASSSARSGESVPVPTGPVSSSAHGEESAPVVVDPTATDSVGPHAVSRSPVRPRVWRPRAAPVAAAPSAATVPAVQSDLGAIGGRE
jgi:serine/threonine protein kinase